MERYDRAESRRTRNNSGIYMADLYKLTSFFATPCNLASVADYTDWYVSDGLTTTYTLVNKLAVRMSGVVQAGSVFYSTNLGQLTIDTVNNQFTLNSAPPAGTIIIAPGVNAISAWAFNTAAVEGDPSPQVKNFPFYIAPETTTAIRQYTYQAYPGSSGIGLGLVDLDPTSGAQLEWLTWCPANPDGTPGTFVPASTSLVVPDLYAQTNFAGPQVQVNDTTFQVTPLTGDLFAPSVGGYLILDPGTASEEQVKLTGQTGDLLTITPAGFTHETGGYIYDFARKYYVQTDFSSIPTGTAPVNLNNIVININGAAISRI